MGRPCHREGHLCGCGKAVHYGKVHPTACLPLNHPLAKTCCHEAIAHLHRRHSCVAHGILFPVQSIAQRQDPRIPTLCTKTHWLEIMRKAYTHTKGKIMRVHTPEIPRDKPQRSSNRSKPQLCPLTARNAWGDSIRVMPRTPEGAIAAENNQHCTLFTQMLAKENTATHASMPLSSAWTAHKLTHKHDELTKVKGWQAIDWCQCNHGAAGMGGRQETGS